MREATRDIVDLYVSSPSIIIGSGVVPICRVLTEHGVRSPENVLRLAQPRALEKALWDMTITEVPAGYYGARRTRPTRPGEPLRVQRWGPTCTREGIG